MGAPRGHAIRRPAPGARSAQAVGGKRRFPGSKDGFSIGRDVDRPVCDLRSKPRGAWAVRLDRHTATRKSVETVAARGVGGVAAVATRARYGDARAYHRRFRDAVGNRAAQRTTRLRPEPRPDSGAHHAKDRDPNETCSPE